MLDQERLVCRAVQSFLPGVNTFLPNETVELAGEDNLASASPLDDSLLQEVRQPELAGFGEFLLAVNQIECQQVLGSEGAQAILPYLLQESEELRILDLTPKREGDLVVVRAGEVWERFALLDA